MSTAPLSLPLDLRAASRRHGLSVVAGLLPLAMAMTLWALAVPAIHSGSLGAAGLVGAAPLTFYLALAVALAGAIFVTSLPQPPGWILAAYITGVVVILYGTIPAISAAPQYSWTYKHIGVVQLIEARGAVSPNVDIYNRWPGLFALAAAFARVTGSNALSFAGWFEFVFAWLEALGVAALAFAITRSRKVAAMSTLVWLLTNWIGQTYFSPQALAYLLSLVLILVVIRQFPVGGRFHCWVTRVVGSVVRRPQRTDALAEPMAWSRWQSVLVVLTLDAAIVATHQLTPYMVVLQLGVLTVLGLRPRWLVLACAGLAVGYLLPNLNFVQSHYGGLFSGINPVDNAQVQRLQEHRAWFYANAGGLLSYATMLLAALGGLRLARAGLAHRAIPVAALSLAPFLLLLGSSYGGEGILRAFLFSSPWLAILIGWGLSTLRRGYQLPIGFALAALLCGLFLFAFIGNAGSNVIPRSEVAASSYFYSHAQAGSVLMLAGEDFPLRIGSRYGVMADPTGGDASPNLLQNPRFTGRVLGQRDLRSIAAAILDFSPNGYLAFSTTETRFAQYYATTPPGAFGPLERAVSHSPLFSLWHSTSNARIYRLTISRCSLERICASDSPRALGRDRGGP